MTEPVAREPTVKFVSSLDEFARRFSLPLMFMGELLRERMVARIRQGQGARQALAPLGAYATDHDTRESRFWVRPGRPQPEGDGFIRRITEGKFAGWAIYRSYKAHADLVGGGAPRDLDETGVFLRSIRTRVLSPSRVKVAPYGSHGGPEKTSNTAVGYLASRREPLPLLHPSAQEIRAAAEAMFAHVDGQAIEAAAIAGVGTQAQSQARSAMKRVGRVLSDRGTRR